MRYFYSNGYLTFYDSWPCVVVELLTVTVLCVINIGIKSALSAPFQSNLVSKSEHGHFT